MVILTLLSGQSTMEFVFHYFDAGIKREEEFKGETVSVKGESEIHITSSELDIHSLLMVSSS